eukprot:TRINITY_DN18193_c0_g1_i1.p1 TRINITY_DN18193_c0_g1~~TRINITY_DN18193_c0_g1_i1.p1  ORF type:complete len:441 (+),score=159.42 TRINITY_DN18193_c0_g1_i1:503-1825(+)
MHERSPVVVAQGQSQAPQGGALAVSERRDAAKVSGGQQEDKASGRRVSLELDAHSIRGNDVMSTQVTVWGFAVNAGLLSCIALVLQNSSLVLMTRWSTAHRSRPINTGFMVLVVELVKMACCLWATAWELKQADPKVNLFIRIPQLLVSRETTLLVLPAALFTLQNYLIFISLANLDATTFQVLSQVKLFLAAIFSVWILKKYLTCIQWSSVLLLMFGIVLAGSGKPSSEKGAPNNAVGVIACLVSGVSSSFAGVYFEKILKGTSTSIAVRNIQIGFPAIVFSFGALLLRERGGTPFVHFNPIEGWDVPICLLVLNYALGGILVAVVVKYADNILKGFATGIAVIISGIFSAVAWGFRPDINFLIGCSLVCVGTVLYHSKLDGKYARAWARILPGGHRMPKTPTVATSPTSIPQLPEDMEPLGTPHNGFALEDDDASNRC